MRVRWGWVEDRWWCVALFVLSYGGGEYISDDEEEVVDEEFYIDSGKDPDEKKGAGFDDAGVEGFLFSYVGEDGGDDESDGDGEEEVAKDPHDEL